MSGRGGGLVGEERYGIGVFWRIICYDRMSSNGSVSSIVMFILCNKLFCPGGLRFALGAVMSCGFACQVVCNRACHNKRAPLFW